ncbi:MAG: RHS repeat-associated core domain-containing protein [Gammaproteobacteria bacterium]
MKIRLDVMQSFRKTIQWIVCVGAFGLGVSTAYADYNWPFGPPPDAGPPPVTPTGDPEPDDPCNTGGSTIECQSQVLGETMRLTGTPFSLNYRSDRVPGHQAADRLTLPLSGASVPASLKRIDLEITVAGQMFTQSFPPTTNQTTTFTWDHKDAYGRRVQGSQPATVRVGYTYDGLYERAGRFGDYGNGILLTGNVARQELTLWKTQPFSVGSFDLRTVGLGAWSLNVHHVYDVIGKVLYLGDGTRRSTTGLRATMTTVAGSALGGFSGDGGPATAAALGGLPGLALGPDGSLYIADAGNHRIRRVGPNGIITTVAGTGATGFSGDGGPATAASLSGPFGLALSLDGSLYIADQFHHRIRRVGPDGIITTVAGTGAIGISGDGGPATAAALNSPFGVALGPDGSLYIADGGNNRIRRVGPDGIITTVAGMGFFGFSGDGGPATAAALYLPLGLALGLDGSLYIADTGNNRIRRVGPDGIITTVAGTGRFGGTGGFSGDGGPATAAVLNMPSGVALGPDGSLYIADSDNRRIRKVASSLPGFRVSEIFIASEDGSELYVFTGTGLHQQTLNTLTGAALYAFAHDANGHLTAVTDGDGNVTTIEHDASGNPTAIVGPYGQRTTLAVDANGYLASSTDPAGDAFTMTYTSDGLLTQFTDPNRNSSSLAYDTLGRLIRDTDAAGGSTALARTDAAQSYTVRRSTALNRTTTYQIENQTTGNEHRVNTFPDGTQTELLIGTDGSRKTTLADGTVLNLLQGPDPRFSMQAPLPASQTITTPGGLTATTTTSRAVTLADPNNLLSLTALTDTLRTNGRTVTHAYNPATKTFTNTSAAGRQSSMLLDNQGRVVSQQIPGFALRQYAYDNQGRLSTFTEGSGADARTFTFDYNAQGFLSSVTDPLLRTEGLEYDLAGRITRQTLPDGREVRFSYDANGNLTSIMPPGRPQHAFSFTPLGFLADYLPPDAGAGTNLTRFTYDADGKLNLVTRPDGTTVDLRYDAAGRLSALVIPPGQVSFSYHPTTGNVATIATPDGGTLSYSDDGDLLTETTWSGTVAGTTRRAYDNDFRLTSQSVNGGQVINLQYDQDGLLTQAGGLTISRNVQSGFITGTTLGNVTDTWTYSSFGELTSYSAASSGTGLYAAQYSNNKLGHITQKIETIGGATDTYTYTYDLVGRLTTAQKNGATIATYTYDSNSNRTSFTGSSGTVNATYDNQDRLMQYGVATYTYTANGEVQSKTTGGQITTYDYDALGNLLRINLPGNSQLDYLIDGQNRRIGKGVNGTLVQGFLYQDQLKPIAELDGNNNVVSRFIYGTGDNIPEYMISGGVSYRIISDQLGSPRLVVDVATGGVAQRMDYDEFGVVLLDTNPGFQPFGFAGGLYDPQTRLTRFGVRDYDAETGRWTIKDPILFAAGDPNLYQYVLSDPVNRIDPSGFQPPNRGATNPGLGCRVICERSCVFERVCEDAPGGSYARCLSDCHSRCDTLLDRVPRNPYPTGLGGVLRATCRALGIGICS